MKKEIFELRLHHKYSSFELIFERTPDMDDCDTNTLTLFLDSLINGKDIDSILDEVKKVDDFTISLEKFLSRIKLAKEKFRNELSEAKKDEIKRLRQNDKQYTTTKAGIYIAEQLNRKLPFSRAQINNYINEGKLFSQKTGVKNIIYQSDLDKFIDKYRDTLRVSY